MLTFNEALNKAKKYLTKANKEARVASLLFEDMFNYKQIDFILNGEKEMSISEYESLMSALDKVSQGLPYQYVTGQAHFYGNVFKVNNHTLIPRNETEELVHLVLNKVEKGSVVDIGTGSGAIGLTLKKENPDFQMILTDISSEALEIAYENMKHFSLNVTLLQGNMLAPLIDRGIQVDVLVSNPPYIAYEEIEYMSESTLNYEPHSALFAKENGLYFYKEIIKELKQVLKPEGLVFFEVGFKQGPTIRDLFLSYWPNSKVEIIKDINGLDRIIYAEWMK